MVWFYLLAAAQCSLDQPSLGNILKLTNSWDGVSTGFGTAINYTCQVATFNNFEQFQIDLYSVSFQYFFIGNSVVLIMICLVSLRQKKTIEFTENIILPGKI
jgi:hypothetical protein